MSLCFLPSSVPLIFFAAASFSIPESFYVLLPRPFPAYLSPTSASFFLSFFLSQVSTIRLECSEVAGLCNSEAYSTYVWEQCPITCNTCLAENLALENSKNSKNNNIGNMQMSTSTDDDDSKNGKPLQLQTWVVVVIGLVTLLVVWGSIHLGVAYHQKRRTRTRGKRVRGGEMEFADDFDQCWDDAGFAHQLRNHTHERAQRSMHDLGILGIREAGYNHSQHVHRAMPLPGHHHGQIVEPFEFNGVHGFGGMTEIDVDSGCVPVQDGASKRQARHQLQQQQQQHLAKQQQQEMLLHNAHRTQQKYLLLAKQQNEQKFGLATSDKRPLAPVAKVSQPVKKCTICRRWFGNTEEGAGTVKCEDCIAMDLEFAHGPRFSAPTPRSKPGDWSIADVMTPRSKADNRRQLFVGRQVYEWNDEITDGAKWAELHDDGDGGCYDNIGGGSVVNDAGDTKMADDMIASPGPTLSSTVTTVRFSHAFGGDINSTAAAETNDWSEVDSGKQNMPQSPPLHNYSFSTPVASVIDALGILEEEGSETATDKGDSEVEVAVRRETKWSAADAKQPTNTKAAESTAIPSAAPISSPRRSGLPMPLKPHGSPLAMRKHGERSTRQVMRKTSLLIVPTLSESSSNDTKYFEMPDDFSAEI